MFSMFLAQIKQDKKSACKFIATEGYIEIRPTYRTWILWLCLPYGERFLFDYSNYKFTTESKNK